MSKCSLETVAAMLARDGCPHCSWEMKSTQETPRKPDRSFIVKLVSFHRLTTINVTETIDQKSILVALITCRQV